MDVPSGEGVERQAAGGELLQLGWGEGWDHEALLFSGDETLDVGNEYGSPVTTDYDTRPFNGKVHRVEIDVGLEDHNHLIKPEDRLNLAMAIQ
jgi:hypothetical protein